MENSNYMKYINGYPEKLYHAIEDAKKVQINQSMSFDECLDIIRTVAGYMGNRKVGLSGSMEHNYDIWEYFNEVYDTIPSGYRLSILLDLYSYMPMEYPNFHLMIKRILCDETKEDKSIRVKMHRERLREHLDEYDCITLYRGANDHSLDEEMAFSYTLDEEVAKWFSSRYGREGWVVENIVHINNVLGVFNEVNEDELDDEIDKMLKSYETDESKKLWKFRSEAEVIIIPEIIQDDELFDEFVQSLNLRGEIHE